jgi:hypothetical protein
MPSFNLSGMCFLVYCVFLYNISYTYKAVNLATGGCAGGTTASRFRRFYPFFYEYNFVYHCGRKPVGGLETMPPTSFYPAEGVEGYFPLILFGRKGLISGGMDAACYDECGAKDFCYNYFIPIIFYYFIRYYFHKIFIIIYLHIFYSNIFTDHVRGHCA